MFSFHVCPIGQQSTLNDLKEFMLMSTLKNIKVKQRIFCEQTI